MNNKKQFLNDKTRLNMIITVEIQQNIKHEHKYYKHTSDIHLELLKTHQCYSLK